MTNEQLHTILRNLNLNECEEVFSNHIYYVKKPIKQRISYGDGSFGYATEEYEFVVVAIQGEKQAIILRCGYGDLHWYVPPQWRGMHVLSNALRTGVVGLLWPENKTVTCHCKWYEDEKEKHEITKHLAEISNLKIK